MAGLLLALCVGAFAQTSSVRVTVSDSAGPIPGADVLIKGTTTGALTGVDGVATLNAKQGDVLVVSFLGYKSEEVTVDARNAYSVFLEPDAEELEETIVVGYGTQKKASLTSSITNIRSEELEATKQPDVIASLQGKVPGLMIRQKSGGAGDFDTDLSLRGYGSPMVVIDGVVRTAQRRSTFWNSTYTDEGAQALAQLNPEDIESISVLKDASASIYGIGAENGVILVTTKQGSMGAPSIKYSNLLAFGFPTALPAEVDVITWMNVANEMRANAGKTPKYTQEYIQKFIDGVEGYTDNRWYEALLKDHSFQHTHNLSVNGGNQQTQYYLSGSFNEDNGLLNNDDLGFHRFTFTGSVTSNITKDLKVIFRSSFNYSNRMGLAANANLNLFYKAMDADRTEPFTVVGDPSKWAYNSGIGGRNTYANVKGADGYDRTKMSSTNNSIEFKYSAPFLKGLDFDAFVSYDTQHRRTAQLTLQFPLYDPYTGAYKTSNKDANQYDESWNSSSNLYGKFQVNYATKIQQHNISAMLAAEARKGWIETIAAGRKYGDFYTHDIIPQGDASSATNDGSRRETATAGFLGRVSYDYAGKYLVEVMARYDGTYVYASGHRWGFFPSYSLGWRVSEEPFFKNNLPWFNNLKFRWSDGLTGGAQGDPYAYLLGYTQTGTNYVFTANSPTMGYSSNTVAETLISWRNVRMRDFGFDWEIKRGIIGGSVDWFWRDTKGIAATSTNTVPDMYGLALPQQNLNANQNVGIDFELSHRNRIGDFDYRVTATATFSRTRPTHIEAESTAIYTSHEEYYKNHTEGRWSNALGGAYYEWNGKGQFANWGEILNYPVIYTTSSSKSMSSEMLPGMYKIDDRNGDGIITTADRYYSWQEANPPLQLGMMIFMSYKGFDLSATINGATLVHKQMDIAGGTGYGYSNTLFTQYMDHYRLADGYTDPRDPQSVWVPGFYPALAPANNHYDYTSLGTYHFLQPYSWVDGTYVRLKSLEIGYALPKNLISKVGLKNARVFMSGTNLITICNKIVKPWDPERNQSDYVGTLGQPLMKTYSLGVNITF